MSNHILKRDAYISEVYSHKDKNEINEGIFDFFKTLMKKEWQDVKSKDTNIKTKLEEVDKGLNGFTLIKMKKAGACATIRQSLADFANTLWDAKQKELDDGNKLQRMLMGLKDKEEISDKEKEQIEKAGNVSKFMRQFDIKDKALVDKLKNYEKKITEVCQGDPDLTRWSNILKDEIRNIVNDMVIAEYEKISGEEKSAKEKIENAKEKIKKQEEEKKKQTEKKNKEEEKKQQDALKQIEKDREKVLSSVGVKPLKGQTGDKAIDTLTSAFDKISLDVLGDELDKKLSENHKYSFLNMLNESEEKKELSDEIKKVLGGDVYFGLNTLEKNEKLDDKSVKIIVSEIKVVFNALKKLTSDSKFKESIKDVPSDAIQAMFVGLSQTIIYALTDEKIDAHKDVLNLLARCAIDSDKTLGYGLPPMDENKPEAGNIFTTLMQTLKDAKDEKGVFGDDKDVLNKFKQNISSIFDSIVKMAEKLKSDRKKKDEQEANKVNQEEENEK